MTSAFTADAARALGGPDWLVQRRLAAAEQLAGLTWPTPSEEIWRYSPIDKLDLARYRPFAAEELGAPGDEPAPGGGPWGAEAGKHAAMLVGMLAFMLYRRERYTSGYSFLRWPAAAEERRLPHAELAEPGQPPATARTG